MALDYSIELKPLSSTFEAIALRKLLSQRFQLQLSSKTKIAFDE